MYVIKKNLTIEKLDVDILSKAIYCPLTNMWYKNTYMAKESTIYDDTLHFALAYETFLDAKEKLMEIIENKYHRLNIELQSMFDRWEDIKQLKEF